MVTRAMRPSARVSIAVLTSFSVIAAPSRRSAPVCLSRSSPADAAAVDRHHGAADPGGARRGKEDDGVGAFLDRAGAALRPMGPELAPARGVVELPRENGRAAWRAGVCPDG